MKSSTYFNPTYFFNTLSDFKTLHSNFSQYQSLYLELYESYKEDIDEYVELSNGSQWSYGENHKPYEYYIGLLVFTVLNYELIQRYQKRLKCIWYSPDIFFSEQEEDWDITIYISLKTQEWNYIRISNDTLAQKDLFNFEINSDCIDFSHVNYESLFPFCE